ncbi:hypothetical protein BIW11_04659 [Tropilaelaps mercedesae]|uniref:Uncharacterized protein n=1 Tax=Tropilaelaps mercedesae TaxID=418985 RepID=A0A1V9X3V1_9ACAR|nr:hypothetical protein BIW11_04659 [Tropilaelaps mercedesae]
MELPLAELLQKRNQTRFGHQWIREPRTGFS